VDKKLLGMLLIIGGCVLGIICGGLLIKYNLLLVILEGVGFTMFLAGKKLRK
jgi:hypothetical protein